MATAYLSFTHYDLLSLAALGRARELPVHVDEDPKIWPSVRNTLWMMVFAVPLRCVFAFCVALMVARAKRGVGFFRTVFYLPTLAPPVAATLGFVYLLNPATGPVNAILGWLHRRSRCGSTTRPGQAVARAAGLWGIGNVMIIFLAACSTCRAQLYEAAAARRRRTRWQRLRYVTLPAISPVILFAVVTGVIEALQYFTQGYVAGSVAGGGAGRADPGSSLGYPEGSTLFYPLLLYQQGFRYFNMGYASAMAVVLFVVAFAVTVVIIRYARRWVHTGGERAGERAARGRAARRAAAGRDAAARVRRQALLVAVAEHSILIALAIMFLRAVRVHRPDGADDRRPGAVAEAVAEPVPVEQLHRRVPPGAALALRAATRCSMRAWHASACWSRASRWPTRSPGCAGAGATLSSCSCSRR